MINTALTGATYDVDGGQQLVAGWRERLDRGWMRMKLLHWSETVDSSRSATRKGGFQNAI